MNFKNDYGGGEPQAQRDWYNGIEFRSKLESKTAQALDNIGIPYVYEPDGYKLSNGLWYRPDFWLPDAKQFVECKGVMDSTDSAKIVGLVDDMGRPVLVLSYDNAMLVMRSWNQPDADIVTHMADESFIAIAGCLECGAIWFLAYRDTWECPHCGAHDGDRHWKHVEDVTSGTQLFGYSQKVAANKPIYKSIANRFNN